MERLARKQATYDGLRALLIALAGAAVIGSLALTLLQSQRNGAVADRLTRIAAKQQAGLDAHDRAVTVRLQQLADLIGAEGHPPRSIVVAGSRPRRAHPTPAPSPTAKASRPKPKPTPKPSPTCSTHVGPICI